MIQNLEVGRRYRFQFTHRKNVHAVVCEIQTERNWFAIYDYSTKQYEGIPSFRLKSFERE